MAFSYWRTGNFTGGFLAPANQGAQGAQNNSGFDGYGYANYVQSGFGRDGWNKWTWSRSCLRIDGSGPAVSVTWDPASKSSFISLSPDKLTATGTTAIGDYMPVLATTAKTTGKWYDEVLIDPEGVFEAGGIGYANTLPANFTNPGSNANGIFRSMNGTVTYNGSTVGSETSWDADTPVVLGRAVNADTGKVWFSINGTWTGDPAAGTGGYSTTISTFYPLFAPRNADTGVLRSTAASQTYTAPSGFSAFESGASPDVTAALTGQSVTVARGTLTPTLTFAITGQALTAAQGTVLQGAPLVGQSITVARGSVTGATTVALTGQSVSVARGSVTPTASLALTGQALVAAQGSVAGASSFALSGQAVTASRGSLLPSSILALLGSSAVVSRGSVTVATTDVTVALTGLSLLLAQGSMTPGFAAALVGSGLTTARGSLAASVFNPSVGTPNYDPTGRVYPFDARIFDYLIFDCPPALVRPTLGGWTETELAEAGWVSTNLARGTQWAEATPTDSQWSANDLARGTQWNATTKGTSTW